MKASLRREHDLIRVQPGRGSDGDDVHRAMVEEFAQVVARESAVIARDRRRPLVILSPHRGDPAPGDGRRRPRMRRADIPAADDANAHGRYFVATI